MGKQVEMVCVLRFHSDLKTGPQQEMRLYIINETPEHFVFAAVMWVNEWKRWTNE